MTQTQPPLGQKQRRQRARNQKQIRKMIMEESVMDERFDGPPVDGIQEHTEQEQPVAQVWKPDHSSARMTSPNTAATASLHRRIMR